MKRIHHWGIAGGTFCVVLAGLLLSRYTLSSETAHRAAPFRTASGRGNDSTVPKGFGAHRVEPAPDARQNAEASFKLNLPLALQACWSDASSPILNGDRSKPVAVEVVPGKVVSFFVDRTTQKNARTWITVGHTAGEASAVVMVQVGDRQAFSIIDPAGQQNFAVVPAATGSRLVNLGSARCGTTSSQAIPAVSTTIPNAPLAALAPPVSGPSNTVVDGGSTVRATFDDLSVTPTTVHITVAAHYSNQVAQRIAEFGGVDGLRAATEVGVQLMNVALKRAGADASVDLVNVEPLNFDEKTDAEGKVVESTLQAYSSAYSTAFAAQKIASTSDLKLGIFCGTPGSFGGISNMPGNFSLVHGRYLADLLIPHELGHSLGMNHNRADATFDSILPYSYGFQTTTTSPAVCTIMAYAHETYSQILTYSNPNYTFQGVPMGDVTTDNARVARERVAAMQTTTTGEHVYLGNSWLLNQSTRGYVGTGENVMIAGLIVSGTAPKQIVVRGIGPSLAQYGVVGALENPVITLFDAASTPIASNDDWQDNDRIEELKATGLQPTNARDAALVRTLAPGAYTVIVKGGKDGNGTGVALVEAFGTDRVGQTFVLGDARYGFGVNAPGKTFDDRRFAAGTYPFEAYGIGFARQVLVVSNNPLLMTATSRDGVGDWTAATQIANHPYRDAILNFTPRANDSMYAVLINLQDSTNDHYFWIAPLGPYGRFTSTDEEVLVYSLMPDARELATPSTSFANLSTRGLIGTGDRVLIGGLIVEGNSPRTFVFRAAGQSLKQYGINVAAKNMTVEVNSNATGLIKRYTATTADDREPLAARALLPTGAGEIGGIVTLAPGGYTFVVKANSESDVGVGMIEVFQQN